MDFNYSQLRLVIFDSIDLAGDNGEYFYRKIRELHPEVKMVFLLSKKSPDWNRLKKDGFNLYPIQGPKVDQFFRDATYILFSKSVLTNKTSHWRTKSIFLQHGTINRYHNLSLYFKSTINRAAKYICCCSKDEQDIIGKMSNNIQVLPVGMPRHDFLLDKWNDYQKQKKIKQIFISFHWRNNEINTNKNKFLKSSYLSDINKILGSEQLKELYTKYNVKIVFYPHAMFRKYLSLFKIPEYIEIPTNKTFQDILIESDCLITDFSSNSFELAYMDKPTFAFVPGSEQVRLTMRQYVVDKLQSYPHINYCKTLSELIQSVSKFVLSNKKFSFSKDIFIHVDQNNSRRLIDWMVQKIESENKKNDIINLKITSITNEGMGVGRYENMAVFVPQTVPGDEISCHIVKVLSKFSKIYSVSVLLKLGEYSSVSNAWARACFNAPSFVI